MAEKPPKGSRVFPALTSETLRAMTGKPSYWLLDIFYFTLMYNNPNVQHREQPSGSTMLPSGKLNPAVASQPLKDLVPAFAK